MHFKKILIVDDDYNLVKSIRTLLLSEGLLVESVDNARLALEILINGKPDLIILDIMMPDLDGYELVKILRNDPSFIMMPIILLTAKGMTLDRIKGYDLGCNAYITKPFHPNELLSIVNNLLRSIDLIDNMKKFENPLIKKVDLISDNLAVKIKENLYQDLTPREVSVLEFVVKGLTNKEIANKLDLNVRNVEKYVSRLLDKTNARNRTELTKIVLSSKLEGE